MGIQPPLLPGTKIQDGAKNIFTVYPFTISGALHNS